MPNFRLFCRKSVLCCDFGIFGVTCIAFNWLNKITFTLKRGFFKIIPILVASRDVWQSHFAHTCCQIHFKLIGAEYTFVAIYGIFQVKYFWLKPCWCKKMDFLFTFQQEQNF